jgi:hypothetical protein
MALWGEKCVRCGDQRTRHTYEGLPTCEPCEERLLARIKADAETPRRCLLDGKVMTKEIVLNLVLDRCPACQGVWLDGGELELLREGLERGMAADFARAIVPPF